jgi:hypothetical protein
MVAGTHVLAFHFSQGAFSSTYDGRTVAFDRTAADHFTSHTPIYINTNEQIFIDDNFGEEGDPQIRILIYCHEEGLPRIRPGLFCSLKPVQKGAMHVSVNVGYGDWYDIWFSVE